MITEYENDCSKDDKIISDVKKYGWSVIMVNASEYLPSFAYTIGLWKTYNHPELIAFGLKKETLHSILNLGGEIVKASGQLSMDKTYDDFFENGSAQFLKVDDLNIPDYFGYAIWFNKKSFPALQLVWTDRNNKFPWEATFEKEFEYKQPLLDRNSDFKFREKENLAIFTTRQWIELNKPILTVMHENDGDWQFLTKDQMPEDIRVVTLKQMILKDKTLNDIFDLEYGEAAEREEIGGEWKRHEIEDDKE